MSHTKEPWCVTDRWGDGIVDIADAEGKLVACNLENTVARRIVACVNACAGIPTPELEVDNPTFVKMLMQRQEALRQRDELLAAAENLIRVKGRFHTEQAYKQLEAIIAKVKL